MSRALADRFRDRVDLVRQAAAEEAVLGGAARVRVPTVAEQRERFFYLFIRVGGFNEPFDRLAGWLLPGRVARQRALARARAELVGEFDKHAGRARCDLTQRLDTVRRGFEVGMRAELDGCIEAIIGAAGRAEVLRRATEDDRNHQHDPIAPHREVAAAVIELDGDPE